MLCLLAACGTDSAAAPPDGAPGGCAGGGGGVSFHQDVTPIIDHCGAELCHGGLGQSWPYSTLVGAHSTECPDQRLLIVPGDPSHSYFLHKLQGQDMCSGERMPKGETPLSASDLATITAWICEGAPDN